jgi:hypothetical protein
MGYCSRCGGSGRIYPLKLGISDTCPRCGGSGDAGDSDNRAAERGKFNEERRKENQRRRDSGYNVFLPEDDD